MGQKTKESVKLIEPTMGQVQDFYSLLCEVGLDKWVSASLDLRRKRISENGKKPVTAEEQVKGSKFEISDEDALQLSLQIDVGMVMQYFGGDKLGMTKLVCIVMDCDEEEARTIKSSVFRENFTHFVVESLTHMSMLLGFAQNTA